MFHGSVALQVGFIFGSGPCNTVGYGSDWSSLGSDCVWPDFISSV